MAGMIEVFIKCMCGADAVSLKRVEQYAKENRIMFSYSITTGRKSTELDREKHKTYADKIGASRTTGLVVYDDGKEVMRLRSWKP